MDTDGREAAPTIPDDGSNRNMNLSAFDLVNDLIFERRRGHKLI